MLVNHSISLTNFPNESVVDSYSAGSVAFSRKWLRITCILHVGIIFPSSLGPIAKPFHNSILSNQQLFLGFTYRGSNLKQLDFLSYSWFKTVCMFLIHDPSPHGELLSNTVLGIPPPLKRVMHNIILKL